MKAWLVRPDGRQVDIGTNFQIGRTPGCALRVDSNEVSRRHAIIHVQQSEAGEEFWLADLGSTNGTIRNGRRLTIPSRLSDGDQITVGDTALVFRQEVRAGEAMDDDEVMLTVPLQAARECWLVMVDIKNFTQITHAMTPEALSFRVGTWFRRTRDIVESAGGVVDKFLGDALFAYWEAGTNVSRAVAQGLRDLQKLQSDSEPEFRIVVHLGPVMFSGAGGGANNVSGLEVISVFRMEKVAANLGMESIVSEKASGELAPFFECEPAGRHALDGFTGTRALFKLPAR